MYILRGGIVAAHRDGGSRRERVLERKHFGGQDAQAAKSITHTTNVTRQPSRTNKKKKEGQKKHRQELRDYVYISFRQSFKSGGPGKARQG